MMIGKRKLTLAHRYMLIDMLENPEPRELEIELGRGMVKRKHIRNSREETVETLRPVPMGAGQIQYLPHLRRASFWELTASGKNVARQLQAIKRRHDGALETMRAAFEAEMPIGSEVVIVYTPDGGQAYRSDDAPDGARIIARGTVVAVVMTNGRPDVRVQVHGVTPITVVEDQSEASAPGCSPYDDACLEGVCPDCSDGTADA